MFIINISINNTVSILQTAGISSNVIPVKIKMNKSIYNYVNLPRINYCNEELLLLDGSMDNEINGITSLLRRRIQNIIFINCIETNDNINYNNKYMFDSNDLLTTFFDEKSVNYVFKSSYLDKLKSIVYDLIDRKLPLVVKMKVEVVSNNKYGIIINENESYTPSIIFIQPSQSNWLDKLPIKTKQYLDNNTNIIESDISFTNLINATFRHFPFNNSIHLNYSKKLVVAMSQMASYDIISNKDLFIL